jgi:hypothetical protein
MEFAPFGQDVKPPAAGEPKPRRRHLFVHASQGRLPIIPLFHYSIIPVVSGSEPEFNFWVTLFTSLCP